VKNIESSMLILESLLVDLQADNDLAGTVLKDDGWVTNGPAIALNLRINASNPNRLRLWDFRGEPKPSETNPHSHPRRSVPGHPSH
jgi:hypothetical protein